MLAYRKRSAVEMPCSGIDPQRIRTRDLRIRSPLTYPLRYLVTEEISDITVSLAIIISTHLRHLHRWVT
jgi:hypothetical protein